MHYEYDYRYAMLHTVH